MSGRMRPKSKVLVREEKVMGSIDMNRLLLCGGIAGVSYGFTRLIALLQGVTLPVVILTFAAALMLTSHCYGVPRYLWLLEGWRAALLIQGRNSPTSLAGRCCDWLQWRPHEVTVNGTRLFATGGSHGHSRQVTGTNQLSGVEIIHPQQIGGLDVLDQTGFEIVAEETLTLDWGEEVEAVWSV